MHRRELLPAPCALRGLAPAIPRWTRDGAPQRYSQKEISSDDEVRSGPAFLCAQARTDLLLRASAGSLVGSVSLSRRARTRMNAEDAGAAALEQVRVCPRVCSMIMPAREKHFESPPPCRALARARRAATRAVLPAREEHEGARGRRHHPAGDLFEGGASPARKRARILSVV